MSSRLGISIDLLFGINTSLVSVQGITWHRSVIRNKGLVYILSGQGINYDLRNCIISSLDKALTTIYLLDKELA